MSPARRAMTLTVLAVTVAAGDGRTHAGQRRKEQTGRVRWASEDGGARSWYGGGAT